MLPAQIINNMPHCPKCGRCNYNLTNDYRLVEIDKNKYTEFVARCLEDKCNEKFYFQSDINMDKTIRYNFDRKDEKEIKDNDELKE